MEVSSSGSAILYLNLEISSPQNKCLSVINLDTTLLRRFAEPRATLSARTHYFTASIICMTNALLTKDTRMTPLLGRKNL